MRRIAKGEEPNALTQHRCAANADYDNFQEKEELRVNLIREQRGLCCYCMSRIRKDTMKIEHWHSQSTHPQEQLDYENLLGTCMGGEGLRGVDQHCDTKKGQRLLSKNPAILPHRVEDFVGYSGDGRIFSRDTGFEAELNETLGLNAAFLKNNRKAVLNSFKESLEKEGQLPRSTVERWLDKWDGNSDTDELEPFCQVVVYWLRKRLNRVGRN